MSSVLTIIVYIHLIGYILYDILHCNCFTSGAAVVAVVIWLPFMTSSKKLDAVAVHCALMTEQFFSTSSTASKIGTHSKQYNADNMKTDDLKLCTWLRDMFKR